MENIDLNEVVFDEVNYVSSDDEVDEGEINIRDHGVGEEPGSEDEDSVQENEGDSVDGFDVNNVMGGDGENCNFILRCPLEELVEGKDAGEIDGDDVMGLEFASIECAELFYRKYSLYVGFGVRRDEKIHNRNRKVLRRRWVCNRAGVRVQKDPSSSKRKRNPRAITRVGCCASMRVKLVEEKNTYVVDNFSPSHNHAVVSPYQLHCIRSNRKVSASSLATAVALRRVGVRTSQIMDLLVSQSGGFEKVGFSKKDLQNVLNRYGYREVDVSDACTALAYLRAKGNMDNGLFVRYNVDENNRLVHLFWSDSGCRYDYACFGDVVGFDATYNKNKYRKPVVVVVGTNSHWRTTVFGVALLGNETYEAYVWLLETFLDAMHRKKPLTVLTDGDKAMMQAVKQVLPNAHHRLCAWHLAKNAQTYVRNSKFTWEFTRLMYKDVSVAEFEVCWANLVTKYRLDNNRWARRMYRLRSMWATAYLRGTFFGGMRTTQRCESLNGVLKEFLKSRFKVYQFVEEMDNVLRRIRNNDLGDDYRSRHSEEVLSSHLVPLEQHASQVFSSALFKMVRDEIIDERDLVVDLVYSRNLEYLYSIKKYLRPEKEWRVVFRRHEISFKCSCKLYESELFPCSHIIAVMKLNHLDHFPDSLISRRWTKNVKPEVDFGVFASSQFTSEVKEMARFATLTMSATRLCSIAAKDEQWTEKVSAKISDLLKEVEGNEQASREAVGNSSIDLNELPVDGVFDPEITRARGGPRASGGTRVRRNKCRKCRCFGHNARCCPKYRGNQGVDIEPRDRGPGHAAERGGPSEQHDGGPSCDLKL